MRRYGKRVDINQAIGDLKRIFRKGAIARKNINRARSLHKRKMWEKKYSHYYIEGIMLSERIVGVNPLKFKYYDCKPQTTELKETERCQSQLFANRFFTPREIFTSMDMRIMMP